MKIPTKLHRFKTSDGIYVKSKSELIIYEFLKSKGVVFLYERPLLIQNNLRYPDFTILRPSDGKIFIWEHFGMMDIESYAIRARQKIREYSCAGYWPFYNFIITYDFGDGKIDMIELERLLKMIQVI